MALAASTETLPPLAALRLERDRFVALAFSWADLLIEVDRGRTIVFAAGATDSLLGQPIAGLLGRDVEELIVAADRPRLGQVLAGGERRERGRVATMAFLGRDGPVTFAVTAYHLPDLNAHDFLALRQAPATRVTRPSRKERASCSARAFGQAVSQELMKQGGVGDASLSLFVICGYDDLRSRLSQAGEQGLSGAISECLRASSLDGVLPGRLDDDRFTLAHAADLDLRAVETQLSALTRAADPEGQGAEIGRATIPLAPGGGTAADDHDVVLEYALNRFRHVEAKPGAVQALSESFAALARRTEVAVRAFRTMVERADFDIVFQPVLHSRSGQLLCYEAFARLPERDGAGSLAQTIDFAEAVGMITDFDQAMLTKAIGWLARNTPLRSTLRLAINISGQSVNSLSFLAHVERTLRQNPWLRGQLMFEITHSARITDFAAANRFIQRMRRRGLQVSLDDFGNLAANFQHLAMLDVDMVKIDAVAIRHARSARRGRAFLQSLVGLCRELAVATVAEKIEDEMAHAFVRDCGVQYVQGYLFGTPSADIAQLNRAIPRHVFEEGSATPAGLTTVDTGLVTTTTATSRRRARPR